MKTAEEWATQFWFRFIDDIEPDIVPIKGEIDKQTSIIAAQLQEV